MDFAQHGEMCNVVNSWIGCAIPLRMFGTYCTNGSVSWFMRAHSVSTNRLEARFILVLIKLSKLCV